MDILQVREIRLYKKGDVVSQDFGAEEYLDGILNENWFATYEQELLFFHEHFANVNKKIGEEIYVITNDNSEERNRLILKDIEYKLIDYKQFARCIETKIIFNKRITL